MPCGLDDALSDRTVLLRGTVLVSHVREKGEVGGGSHGEGIGFWEGSC